MRLVTGRFFDWRAWRLRRVSLQARVLGGVTAAITVLLVGEAVIDFRAREASARTALFERAHLMATTQADAVATALWDFDDLQVQGVLDALALDPDFVAAFIVEDDREPKWHKLKAEPAPGQLRVKVPIVYPHGNEPERLGELDLHLSTERHKDALEQAMIDRAWVLLTLLGTVLAAVYTSIRRVTGPLQAMTGVMVGLSQGNNALDIPATRRLDEIGDMARAVLFFKNSSVEMDRLRAIHDEAKTVERLRIQGAIESCKDAVIVADAQGLPLYANPAYEELFGWKLSDIRGRNLARTYGVPNSTVLRLFADVRRHGVAEHEATLQTASGKHVPVSLRVSTIRGRDGTLKGYVALATDVTERRQAAERIWHIAHHDALTGLPNRLLFRQRVEAALKRARRSNERFGILMIDLDHFKEVNDSLGHGAGDALLHEVSRRLKDCVRRTDTVARLGGDEFAILLDDTQRDSATTAEVAERVVECMQEAFALDGRRVHSGTSVGMVLFPDHGDEADCLLRHADLALYAAKNSGRNRYQCFHQGMVADLVREQEVQDRLRLALEAGTVEVHYQPQLCLKTMRVVGVEALARWTDEKLGRVSPAEFVPLAERSKLILDLSHHVLRRACSECRGWPDLVLSVNLSPAHLRCTEVVEAVRGILEETGFPAYRLDVEVTEGVLLSNAAEALERLHALKSLGVRLSLDDFGTGYSSLSYLQRFPFNTLKIDRSFVGRVNVDPTAGPIVRAIVSMATALNMRTVAEGVETDAQRIFLQRQGCDVGQGYLFSHPLPAKGLGRYLAPPERLVAAGVLEQRGR